MYEVLLIDKGINSYITELSNIVIAITGFSIYFFIRHWIRDRGLTHENAIVFAYVGNWILFVSIRVSWWIPALSFAPAELDYHPFFTDWKWLMTIITGAVCLKSAKEFISMIERFTARQQFYFYTVTLLTAVLIPIF